MERFQFQVKLSLVNFIYLFYSTPFILIAPAKDSFNETNFEYHSQL